MAQLHDLLKLLTSSITQLEQACEKNGTSIPNLEDTYTPSSEAFRKDPIAARAASIASAAALHICTLLNQPQSSLFEIVGGPMKAAALRICLESNVAEILREAGAQGLHVKDIATRNGVAPSVLSGCLRYLATFHIFKEMTPDVFTNTRISSLLDTGKPSQELLAHPEQKYDNTTGLAALVAFQLDESTKAAASAWEVCSDPATAKSGEPSQSGFARLVSHGKTLWEYFDQPENASRRHLFNIAMHGVQRLQPPDIMLSVYDWKTVPAGAVIVDVGGGVGTTQLCLAREFPDFQIIIQDRSQVIEDGIKMWRERNPDALQAGRVTFEAQDFFQPQPKRDVSFYFLKQILHDWSDKYCCKILGHLRQAASANTKLLSMDSIIPYACRDDSIYSIPGATPDVAPSPLLSNWGAINTMAHRSDLAMLSLFNARERTIGDAVALFKQCGWKVVEVHRQKEAQGSYLQCIEAVPI